MSKNRRDRNSRTPSDEDEKQLDLDYQDTDQYDDQIARSESNGRSESRGSSALRQMFTGEAEEEEEQPTVDDDIDERPPSSNKDQGRRGNRKKEDSDIDERPPSANKDQGRRENRKKEDKRRDEDRKKDDDRRKRDEKKKTTPPSSRKNKSPPAAKRGKSPPQTSRRSKSPPKTSRKSPPESSSNDSSRLNTSNNEQGRGKDRRNTVKISKDVMKQRTSRDEEDKPPATSRITEEQLLRMKTPDFRTQKNMVEYDVVIKTDRGGELFAHRAVLSMWSPVFEELFNEDEYKECANVILDLSDQKTEDVAHVLAVIYPPNREVTEKNVFILLKMAKIYQMQEVTSRCEQCLLSKRKPGIDMLLCAQNYNLPDLKKKCIDYLQNQPFWEIERHRRTRELSDATKAELYTAVLEAMEEKHPNVQEKAKALFIRFDEFKKLFSDLKTAFRFEGDKDQEKVYNRALAAIDDLANDETIDAMPRPYTEPSIPEDIEEGDDHGRHNNMANGEY